MSFIETHIAEGLMIAGIILLIVEMLVLGFSTFILLFLGLSFFLSGLLMSIGVVPEGVISALWMNSIFTILIAAILWGPLKRMQKHEGKPGEIKSDFIGQELILKNDVDLNGKTQYSYSGVSWKLKSKTPLAKGTHVRVVRADVGVLWVEAVQANEEQIP